MPLSRALLLACLLVPLPARADDLVPKLPPLVSVKEVKATSTLVEKGKPEDAHAAWRVMEAKWVEGWEIDADGGQNEQDALTSTWCEGKADEGLGEALTIELAAPTQIDVLTIYAGVWAGKEQFEKSNFPTAVGVSVDGGKEARVTVKPERV